jgi:hypothetical protein
MTDSIGIFDLELRVSYRYFLPILAYSGAAFTFAAQGVNNNSVRLNMQFFGILVFGIMSILWIIDRWVHQFAQFAAVSVACCTILAGAVWSGDPSFLALIVIPIAVSAAVINLRSAALTTLGFTLVMILLIRAGLDFRVAAIPLVLAWFTAAIMVVIYLPIYRIIDWCTSYYEQAAHALEESRTQRVELKQMLSDLERANLHLTRLNRLAQGLRKVAEEARGESRICGKCQPRTTDAAEYDHRIYRNDAPGPRNLWQPLTLVFAGGSRSHSPQRRTPLEPD